MAFTRNQVRWVDGETVPVLDPDGVNFTQNNVRWVDGETIPVLDPEASGDAVPRQDQILFNLL